MRRTLSDARASRIPRILGVCADSPVIPEFINEATERLLVKGHYWGSFGRFRLCVDDGCVTLPPQIASLDKANVCGSPIRLHDVFWEFLENGGGAQHQCRSTVSDSSNQDPSSTQGCNCNALSGCGYGAANFRGQYPTFLDIKGANKKLLFVCDLSADVGNAVIVMGYDQNNNWIRQSRDGTIQDGERIIISQAPGTQSVNFFSSVTDIQFRSDRNGQFWLYEYNTSDATQRLIGSYQYWETRPSYQRYFFGGIRTGSTDGVNCTKTQIEVVAKLAFIPVKNDIDYLLIGNIPAMKEMCRAIWLAENEPNGVNANNILITGEKLALRELDFELQHYRGPVMTGVDLVGASVGSAQPIEALL